MKKIIIIIILVVVSLNNFSQRVYSEQEYLKQAYKNNIISVTTSPMAFALGLSFISKPLIEINRPIALFSSIEYANYENIDTKLFKFAIGPSIIIRRCQYNLGLSLNTDPKHKVDNYKEISFEAGITGKVENLYFSFLMDIPNNHIKFGIGIGF